jgi:type I restriction enzyme, S subunit
VGTTAIISKSLVGANCHALIISRFKKEIADSDYFCQYFNSRLCQKSFKSIEIGTSLKHLNGSDMKRLQFVLPPLPEQQKIASILSNVDSKITSQEQYKENLERLKKSLMQKLLTGEIRV